MATDPRPATDKRSSAAAAAAVLLVLVVFLFIQTMGSPITTFGSLSESVLYSVVVFIPVAAVCLLAVAKSGRKDG